MEKYLQRGHLAAQNGNWISFDCRHISFYRLLLAERSATFDGFICIPRERELWIFKCVVVWSLKEAAQICYRCVSTLIMSADLLCDRWVSWECTTSVHIWVVFVKVDICVKTSDNVAERANSKRVISNIFRALTGKRLQTPAGFSNCQGNSGQGGVIMNVHLYWNSG